MIFIYLCNTFLRAPVYIAVNKDSPNGFISRKVKLERAHGGCLGTRSLRRTALTPICSGEL